MCKEDWFLGGTLVCAQASSRFYCSSFVCVHNKLNSGTVILFLCINIVNANETVKWEGNKAVIGGNFLGGLLEFWNGCV